MKKSMFAILALTASYLLGSCGGTPAQDPSKPDASSNVPSTASASQDPGDESSSSASNSGEAAEGFIKNDVSIDFWYNGNDSSKAWFEAMINQFKAIEPKVTINYTKQSGSYNDVADLVSKGIAADNYPDMYVGYPDSCQEVINAAKAVNMDPYIDNPDYGWTEEEKEDIVDDFLDEGKQFVIPGTYSLPFAKSTEALFYNKTKLINLVLPGVNNGNGISEAYLNSLTWEEFFDVLCPALATYNNSLPDNQKLYTIAEKGSAILSYDSDENLFITLAEQYGYGYTNVDNVLGQGQLLFNNENMRNLLKQWNGYRKNNYVCTELSATKVRGNTLFAASNSLFYVGSTGGLKYAADAHKNNIEVGVARVPYARGKTPKVISQGPSIIFIKHPKAGSSETDTDRILASWLFTKFVTNPTNAMVWSINTGYSPIHWSAYESAEWQEYCDASLQPNVLSLEHLQAVAANYVSNVNRYYFSSPVFKGSATARSQVGSLIGTVLNLEAAECTDAKLVELFNNAENIIQGKME